MKRLLLILAVGFLGTTVCSADGKDYAEFIDNSGRLRFSLLNDNAVRIQYIEGDKEPGALSEWLYLEGIEYDRQFKVKEKNGTVVLKSEKFSVVFDKSSSTVKVLDKEGKAVFKSLLHQLKPSKVQEVSTNQATLVFDTEEGEHLYGLGQFQDGHTDLNGHSRRLTQVNTQISMPFLLSSNGYALLWNNYGLTEFNPAETSVNMKRISDEGTETIVDVTSTEGGIKEKRISNLFGAEIEIAQDGEYALLLDVGQKMSRKHNLTIDGKLFYDINNLWLPPTMSIKTFLTAGRHTITAELNDNDKPVLHYRKVVQENVLYSPVADCVDYTVFVGSADETIASYRSLTGESPMLPRWAFGYIHCRERFNTQAELLENARTFRDKKIPLDLIVQDWLYWGKYGWNAMQFDEDNYPDPGAMVDELHKMNMRLMISVWSKIDENSELGKQTSRNGYFIPGTVWVDFFNKDAADFYWENMSSRLLKYGIDAWWQDATEPENDDLAGRRVMNGTKPGELYRNVYPNLVSKAVYEGLRKDDPQRRAMILTRSGFSGIQRYGSVLWSGDVGNDWETLRRQIAGGLGMMSSGHPWWTFDAGGFFRPGGQYNDKEYVERMLRWIQAAVFAPFMRVHGYQSQTEPWRYGKEAERIIDKNIRLRYSLLPYIYSGSADICFEGSTFMRPLVFDFADDPKALEQPHTYMFGKSLLVNPITEAGVSTWKTYLPVNEGGWFDFKTGKAYEGGKEVETAADIESIPVFARGGSIVPVGPEIQHTGENYSDPIQLRVYPGADAEFVLYEDEGENYDYEKGEFSQIRMKWSDAKNTLTIYDRTGGFDGMQNDREFMISLPDGKTRTISYLGKKITVDMSR